MLCVSRIINIQNKTRAVMSLSSAAINDIINAIIVQSGMKGTLGCKSVHIGMILSHPKMLRTFSEF